MTTKQSKSKGVNQMTEQERYNKYIEMQREAKKLEEVLRFKYEQTDRPIYTIFFAPEDEEKDLYFVDVEIGKSEAGSYRRIRGTFSHEKVLSMFFGTKQTIKCLVVD